MTKDTSPAPAPPADPLADITARRAKSPNTAPALPTFAPLNFVERWQMGRDYRELRKSIEMKSLTAQAKALEAAEQAAIVNPVMDTWGIYENVPNVQEPTGQTFAVLRRLAHQSEVCGMIHNKVIEQVAPFCQRSYSTRKWVAEPGFRIKLADPELAATPDDKKRMAELAAFMEEAGWPGVEPPEDEKPLGWQPGLEYYVRCLLKDSLTLDHTATRLWKSAKYPDKFPIVCFAAVDAGLIRFRRVRQIDVRDGRPVYDQDDKAGRRVPKSTRIDIVKVSWDGDQIGEAYKPGEMVCATRRPRTDEMANGYGYSEIEQAISCIGIWIAARVQNGVRFSQDSLPRGILSMLGTFNEQQFQQFTMQFKQMLNGTKGRWNIPLVKGSPTTGSSIQWTPFDLSPRDMEYSNFTYSVGMWLHSLYGISPDETGFSATSPFRPPLSEASPEVNLKYSQDTCLMPKLRWLQNHLNRNILWKIEPSRRYKFEFIGVGDYDESQDVAMRMARMQAGLSTPAMEWNEMDVDMPPEILKDPAANYPAPFVQGQQALLSMQQAKDAAAQAKQQQDQAQAQQEAQGQQDAHGQAMDKRKQDLAESQHDHQKNMDYANFAQGQQLPQAGSPAGEGSASGLQGAGAGEDAGTQNAGNASELQNPASPNENMPDNASEEGSEDGEDDPDTAGMRFGGGVSTRPMAGKAVKKSVVNVPLVIRL